MLKVISKMNCPRCENIKNYLKTRGISYEEEMAENNGYEYWRDMASQMTGKLGFPILCKIDSNYPIGSTVQSENWVNGSSDEIIEKINEWFPNQKEESAEKCNSVHFDWGLCGCGYKGKDYENKE